MAKRNSSEMQTGNAEGQVRRPKKGGAVVGGAPASGRGGEGAGGVVFFFRLQARVFFGGVWLL